MYIKVDPLGKIILTPHYLYPKITAQSSVFSTRYKKLLEKVAGLSDSITMLA
jgi:hypothetical protein